jgi:ribosome modulation factor
MKDPQKHVLYIAGRMARVAGKGRNACPFGLVEMLRHSLWLAGWHDADMEA